MQTSQAGITSLLVVGLCGGGGRRVSSERESDVAEELGGRDDAREEGVVLQRERVVRLAHRNTNRQPAVVCE